MILRPGNWVTYFDDDGERHQAVVIDIFERSGDVHAPYVNLAYNPDKEEFGGNTLSDLEGDTSVPHIVDENSSERTYTTETMPLIADTEAV